MDYVKKYTDSISKQNIPKRNHLGQQVKLTKNNNLEIYNLQNICAMKKDVTNVPRKGAIPTFKQVKPKTSLSPGSYSDSSDSDYDQLLRPKLEKDFVQRVSQNPPNRFVKKSPTKPVNSFFDRSYEKKTSVIQQKSPYNNPMDTFYERNSDKPSEIWKSKPLNQIPKIKTKKKREIDENQMSFTDMVDKKRANDQKKKQDEIDENIAKIMAFKNKKQEQNRITESSEKAEGLNFSHTNKIIPNANNQTKVSDFKKKDCFLMTGDEINEEINVGIEKVMKLAAEKKKKENQVSEELNTGIQKVMKMAAEMKKQAYPVKDTSNTKEVFRNISNCMQIEKKDTIEELDIPYEDFWVPDLNYNDTNSQTGNHSKDCYITKDEPIKKEVEPKISHVKSGNIPVSEVKCKKEEIESVAPIFKIPKKSEKVVKQSEENKPVQKKRDYHYEATEEDQNMEAEIYKIRNLTKLKEEHIDYMVLRDINYFIDIFSGNCEHSWRHLEFKKRSKKSSDILYSNAAGMGTFTQYQIQAGVGALQSIFCRDNNKLDDYIVKVLLPEALIKICMRIHQCSKDDAEDYLKKINLK